jgi:hypothetical protein
MAEIEKALSNVSVSDGQPTPNMASVQLPSPSTAQTAGVESRDDMVRNVPSQSVLAATADGLLLPEHLQHNTNVHIGINNTLDPAEQPTREALSQPIATRSNGYAAHPDIETAQQDGLHEVNDALGPAHLLGIEHDSEPDTRESRSEWGMSQGEINENKKQLLAFYKANAPEKAHPENVDTAFKLFGPNIWKSLEIKYGAAKIAPFVPTVIKTK